MSPDPLSRFVLEWVWLRQTRRLHHLPTMNEKNITAERIWYSGYARPIRESNDIKGVVYETSCQSHYL